MWLRRGRASDLAAISRCTALGVSGLRTLYRAGEWWAKLMASAKQVPAGLADGTQDARICAFGRTQKK